MARREKPPRERAARALCEAMGGFPDTQRDKRPTWTHYLPVSDVVLRAALGDEAWQAMVEVERKGCSVPVAESGECLKDHQRNH